MFKDNVLRASILLLKNYNEIIGFAAENNYLNQLVTRYTNFYLKPMERIGKLLLDRIALLQSKTNGSTMSLNVTVSIPLCCSIRN
jgi:hypothetical protein